MSNSNAARAFHALHQSGLLILPNAWDAGSARIIEHAGAKAIATSSAASRAGWQPRDRVAAGHWPSGSVSATASNVSRAATACSRSLPRSARLRRLRARGRRVTFDTKGPVIMLPPRDYGHCVAVSNL